MKAIVHIGTEKTGTTSIQQYLYMNREKLSSAGYHFVQSPGKTNNQALPAYCISDEKFDDFFRDRGITTLDERQRFKQSFIKEFEYELQSLPENIHTVLISSEHFHSRIRTEKEMDNVYELMSTYFDEIKIICYLREQIETCTSYYSTILKNGDIESFRRFLSRCNPKNPYFNYQIILEKWERFFGLDSLDVSLFAKDYFLNGNLLDDFTAKIDPSLLETLNQNVKIENMSLTRAGQVLLRAVNLVFPKLSELPQVADIRDQCKKLILRNMTGKCQQPDLKTWESSFKSFSDCNEEVRRKFFPHVKKLFADPVEVEPTANVIDGKFSEALISIVSLIKRNKTDAFMPEVYQRLWSAISTCITEVEDVEGVGFKSGPPPVVLTDQNAHLLINIAKTIADRNPQAARKLMALAAQVKPNFPSTLNKPGEHRKKCVQEQNAKSKSKFILTFHGGETTPDKNKMNEINLRFRNWIQSPNIYSIKAIGFVKNNNVVINVDGVVAADNSSVLKGYIILHAESLDEAITIAKACPHLAIGGTITVSGIAVLPPSS